MEKYRIAIYSPDEHIQYDGSTPDKTGVGGGITVRIRMAAALAGLGHQVTMYANVPTPGTFDGVQYMHFSEAHRLDCDIFMVQSTGGRLDLSSLRRIKLNAGLKVARFGGFAPVKGWKKAAPAAIYTNSNFTRKILISDWKVPASKLFVLYNGLDQDRFTAIEQAGLPPRDPFGLLYVGHPAKGLERARQILRKLRRIDKRYHLDVYGGYAIWGDTMSRVEAEPGLNDIGLVSNDTLIRALYKYRYGLFIQSYEEPFGISAQEARRAGVISICTPVGAFPELFHHGVDGFIIDEPYQSDQVVEKSVDLILSLSQNPDAADYISLNASQVPWSWKTMASTLSAHWERLLTGNSSLISKGEFFCPECLQHVYLFPDGLHCMQCGWYSPRLPAMFDKLSVYGHE